MTYVRTTWTTAALKLFCERTERPEPHSTQMEAYYFKYYEEEIKAIETELKLEEKEDAL